MIETPLTTALAILQARVGTEVHVSEWLVITQDRVDAFAAATGDAQWIHTDPVRAERESPWGTTIAHGYLTLALQVPLRGLLETTLREFPAVHSVINYGLNRLRFPTPVRVGSRIRGRFTLQGVETLGADVLQVTERYTVEVDGETKPACIAESVMRMVFRS